MSRGTASQKGEEKPSAKWPQGICVSYFPIILSYWNWWYILQRKLLSWPLLDSHSQCEKPGRNGSVEQEEITETLNALFTTKSKGNYNKNVRMLVPIQVTLQLSLSFESFSVTNLFLATLPSLMIKEASKMKKPELLNLVFQIIRFRLIGNGIILSFSHSDCVSW